MNRIEKARQKYRPAKVRLLFVAESPPPSVERFFYYEDVREKDSLFLEMMKVLYVPDASAPEIRPRKAEYLRRFREDGYFLMDALDEPIGVKGTAAKTKKVVAHRDAFLDRLSPVVGSETPIILIARPVYDGLLTFLNENGFNVVNSEMIDFPGSGRQGAFKEKMGRHLTQLDK